jgi:NADPH:quinone reductase-like Zn-dependent oxidoreductase
VRAAVIHETGAAPTFDQFPDPRPGPGVAVGTVVAAALNPLDLTIVNGQFPLRRFQPPYVAGYEAVVQLEDGTRRYVTDPPAPYGTLAEFVPVPDAVGFPVPDDLAPGLAVALGTTGIVGWAALEYRGQLQPGETVLVIGAGGSAGQLAMQSARILGAGRVVGAARGEALRQAADHGADAVVDLADDQDIAAGLTAAAPRGYDVIIDFLWGAAAPHAISQANVGARYVQVGSSAGPTATIAAPDIRNSLLTLVGHGLFRTPTEVRRSAYEQLVQHASEGRLSLELEQTRLEDISQVWERLKNGSPRKLVVTP